jgi:hypothetical protein
MRLHAVPMQAHSSPVFLYKLPHNTPITHIRIHAYKHVQDTLIAIGECFIKDSHTFSHITSMLQANQDCSQEVTIIVQKRTGQTDTSQLYDHGAGLRYEIAKLTALRDDGLVTHTEFEAKIQALCRYCHKVRRARSRT